MQTLATNLAEYQHKIGKTLAEQKPVVTAGAGAVGSSCSSTGPAVPGAAPAAGNNGGGENSPAGPSGEGSQAVEQDPLQASPKAVVAATRTTSPDRGAGGQSGCTTTSSMQETKLQKRAEDCSHEELMQRRPANKVAKMETAAAPMDIDVAA